MPGPRRNRVWTVIALLSPVSFVGHCLGAVHSSLDHPESHGPERTNHPCLGRFDCVRRLETVGSRWGEAATGVVERISENKYKVNAQLRKQLAPELDQAATDARSLVSRQDGERGED